MADSANARIWRRVETLFNDQNQKQDPFAAEGQAHAS